VSSNFVKSALRAYIEAQFGGPTTEQESIVTVASGVGLTLLVKGNAERVSLTFVNLGSFDVIFGFGGVLASGGIRLVASGGAINFIVRDDATLPGREWYANGPGGSSNVYVLEVIRSIYTPPSEMVSATP
jgi:hypothetical protein